MRRTSMESTWLRRLKARPDAPMCLVCFPHAGRGATLYHPWSAELPGIEVWSAQLPGRENRLGERPVSRIEEIVASMVQPLRDEIDRPFAFLATAWGRSWLSSSLAGSGAPAGPNRHLFVAGFRAPQLPNRHPLIADLSEAAFVDRLLELSGTPAGVLEHEELRSVVIPTLRADFTACETYSYAVDDPLGCAVDAFCSLEDPLVTIDEVAAWAAQTLGPFRLHRVPGNHFELLSSASPLLPSIADELMSSAVGIGHGRIAPR